MKKIGYYFLTAGLAFSITTYRISISQGELHGKVIFFLSTSAILLFFGVLLVLLSKKNGDKNDQRIGRRKFLTLLAIGFVVGLSSFFFKVQKIKNTQKKRYNLAEIVSKSVRGEYKFVKIVSHKKTDFVVPYDLDSPYAYFGEGNRHRGWQANCLIKPPNGTVKQYSIFISEDGKVLHTDPFDLIKKIKSNL